MKKTILFIGIVLTVIHAAYAQKTNVQVQEPGYKVFQFPRTMIPRIDGEFTDWDIVP